MPANRSRSLAGTTVANWKESLRTLLAIYERARDRTRFFYFWLFLFFVFLNVFFFWLALRITYPEFLIGFRARYYHDQLVFMQFPVGVLGGIFDFLSFFITLFVVRRALQTRYTASYLAHLSVDIVIAVIATFWVVLVIVLAGWLYNVSHDLGENLAARRELYEDRMKNVALEPVRNWRNLLFGFLVGFSAMFPTVTHLYTSLVAFGRAVFQDRRARAPGEGGEMESAGK